MKEHFDLHTAKLSNGRPRLLIIDGYGSHLTFEFCSYALSREIYLICFPAHSKQLLQPLDDGLFSPLQHYYGKVADTHIRETRTAITKGMFWKFFTEAKSKAYSEETIQAAFRSTGIHPLNPDKVLNKVRPTKAVKTVCPIDLHMKTPRTRRDLRQQTQFALRNPQKHSTIVLKLSHAVEEAMIEAEIAKLQLQDLRLKYEGKRALKSDRRVLSKAQVITGAEVIALRETIQKKEIAKLLKAELSKT